MLDHGPSGHDDATPDTPDDVPRLTGLLVDWSGTIVDFGARAQATALVGAFEESSIRIGEDVTRPAMGAASWEHIRAILAMPAVTARWREVYGRDWSTTDIDMIHERFLPLQAEAAERFAVPVPGAVEALNDARALGLKVGSTSAFPRRVMERVMEIAGEQGLAVDACACVGDTPMGRPMPFMLYKMLLDLELGAVWKCVVVDDTPLGIQAARNAGTWAVGVTISGNAVGMSTEQWTETPKDERDRLRRHASELLKASGAHFVVDSIAGLGAVLTRLNSRLVLGERP